MRFLCLVLFSQKQNVPIYSGNFTAYVTSALYRVTKCGCS